MIIENLYSFTWYSCSLQEIQPKKNINKNTNLTASLTNISKNNQQNHVQIFFTKSHAFTKYVPKITKEDSKYTTPTKKPKIIIQICKYIQQEQTNENSAQQEQIKQTNKNNICSVIGSSLPKPKSLGLRPKPLDLDNQQIEEQQTTQLNLDNQQMEEQQTIQSNDLYTQGSSDQKSTQKSLDLDNQQVEEQQTTQLNDLYTSQDLSDNSSKNGSSNGSTVPSDQSSIMKAFKQFATLPKQEQQRIINTLNQPSSKKSSTISVSENSELQNIPESEKETNGRTQSAKNHLEMRLYIAKQEKQLQKQQLLLDQSKWQLQLMSDLKNKQQIKELLMQPIKPKKRSADLLL